MSQQTDAALLGRAKLFAGLDAGGLQAIADSATSQLVRTRHAVFRQGDKPTHLHMVADGWIKIAQLTASGTVLTIRFMQAGDVPGCVAVFRQIPFPATATAVVNSRVLTWPAARITELIDRNPAIAANAMEIAGIHTESMLQRLGELASDPVGRRIARALLALSRQAGRAVPSGVEIGFPLSRQDIAEMTGSTLYTVSRTLRGWERAQIVRSGRQRVMVCDPQALSRLAEITGK